MAMCRLHRGIDARDVTGGHQLALTESEENYRIFILSAATPFKQTDFCSLKQTPKHVLYERCPSICELFESRHWALPQPIDRVYDSSEAQ
jgi:hypothetical protein